MKEAQLSTLLGMDSAEFTKLVFDMRCRLLLSDSVVDAVNKCFPDIEDKKTIQSLCAFYKALISSHRENMGLALLDEYLMEGV